MDKQPTRKALPKWFGLVAIIVSIVFGLLNIWAWRDVHDNNTISERSRWSVEVLQVIGAQGICLWRQADHGHSPQCWYASQSLVFTTWF